MNNSHNNSWPIDVGYFEQQNRQPIFGQSQQIITPTTNNNTLMQPIIGSQQITGQPPLIRHGTELSSGGSIINGNALMPNPSLSSNRNSLVDVGSLAGLMSGMQMKPMIKINTQSTQTEGVNFNFFVNSLNSVNSTKYTT